MSVDAPTRSDEPGLSVAPEPVILDAGPQPDRIPQPSKLAKAWAVTWPKLLAVGLALTVWQLVYVAELKPAYLLPGPATALAALAEMAQTSEFWQGLRTTVTRGVVGFLVAVLIGSLLGIAVSQWRVLRLGVGSMVTGLQTMPSIWSCMASRVIASSAAKGSSMSTISASWASTRASAPRWRIPPDSSWGRRLPRPPRCTIARSSSTRSARSLLATPRSFSASETFCSSVSQGNSVDSWNMNATLRPPVSMMP